MKKFILLLLLVSSSAYLFAQNFEGTAVFKITYENLPPEMKGHEGMMPSEFTFLIKNQKSRMEMSSMMGPTIVITDNEAKKSTTLMNMGGQKMKMTIDFDEAEEIEDNAANNVKIEYVDGTKEIAGYTCKKAIMKVKSGEEGDEDEGEIVFYYSPDIEPIENMKGFEGLNLKGMPLEYSISNRGIKMVVTATSIEKKPIDDSVFVIPEGYTEIPDSMKQMMQQQK
ncbi:MAG: DUF4412 domain-containing protein [Cyclobacteriaceae bacterium]|nr:DUF4412 domain-containing protein [Cyclobacteriaceae bacterium]